MFSSIPKLLVLDQISPGVGQENAMVLKQEQPSMVDGALKGFSCHIIQVVRQGPPHGLSIRGVVQGPHQGAGILFALVDHEPSTLAGL